MKNNKTVINQIEKELEKEKFKLNALQFNFCMSRQERLDKAKELTATIRHYERDLARMCR